MAADELHGDLAGKDVLSRSPIVPLDQLEDFKVAEGDSDVRGWEVVASDGRKIGEVDELLVDTAAMKVRYLDVNLDGLVAGALARHVLIPIGYARLDENDDRIMVERLASADVRELPEYTCGPITRHFEAELRARFSTGDEVGADTITVHDFHAHGFHDENRSYGNSETSERREEAVIERRPVDDPGMRTSTPVQGGEILLPLHDEELIVEKRVVPKEELVVRKRVEPEYALVLPTREGADTETMESGGARTRRPRESPRASEGPTADGPSGGGGGRRTGAGRGDDSGREPPSPRYIQARTPTRARVNEGVPLLARIALAPGPDAFAELASFPVPPEGAEVEIAVRSATLQFLSPTCRGVRVLPDADSEWVLFEFRGQVEAVHDLQVLAFRGGALLGVLHLEITVDTGGRAGTMFDWSEPADFREPVAGEVTWEVRFDRATGCYRYQLHGSVFGWTDEIRTDQLLRPPEEAVGDFVAKLNAQARNLTQYTDREAREWLRAQGSDLWNEMIPKEFERFFWEHREKITRLTILSPGDPMPWEALYPGSDSGQDAGFLAEQFTVTRWVYGPPASRSVHLTAPYFVVPEGSPATAASEVEALQRVVGGTPVEGLTPLLDLLGAGQFDLLHFACHNRFVPESPSSSYIEMDGSKHFEFSLVPRRRPWQNRSPVVFMNACRSDAQGANYTRLDGWAKRFLGAGAGAFIGSLWEVRDRTASRFAEAFYGALRSRKALGEAMREGREAIRAEPGDPTWLAYTLYGDPAATLAEGVR